MKNPLLYLVVLVLAFFIIPASSCHKEEPEPDLVPITTTGANTMGFYWDGIPVNKKGKPSFNNATGVNVSIYSDNTVKIFGGGGVPFCEIAIRFAIDENNPENKMYKINTISATLGEAILIDDSPLGGLEFYTNDSIGGTLEIIKYSKQLQHLAGKFDIKLQSDNGKIIHLTDGRFDIKK